MVVVSEGGLVIGMSKWGLRSGLIWPAGYEARRDIDGRVEIVRPDAKVVVREGEWFLCGGSSAAASEQDIAASAVSAFLMQDEPVRIDAK
jgi:hypothetical protein